MPFQVARFGVCKISGTDRLIGNHCESTHGDIISAIEEVVREVSKLEEEGYKVLGPYNGGDACEDGYTLERNRTFMHVGYWEVW